jgi:putative copper resistance protein D
MHVIPEWLELISLAFCIGVIFCRLWFFTPSTQDEFSYNENFVPRMWTLFCFGLAFLMAGSLVELLSRTAEMSGQPFPAFFSSLTTVLLRTHYGLVWIIRIVALFILALLKTAVRYRDKRAFLFFMLFLVLIVSMTASASGHASDAGDFSLPEIMDWLHLLAASAWGGGLMVLSLSVLPDLIGRRELTPALISRVASRFSSMAGFAVCIVAITAVYNAWKYVGSINALLGAPYGWTVVAKIVLFLVLINLGGFNRYVSVPLLQEWAGASTEGRGIFTRIALQFFPGFQLGGNGGRIALRFRRGVKVEAILIISVLLCAALLRHEIPARHASHLGHTGGGGQPMQHYNHEGNM